MKLQLTPYQNQAAEWPQHGNHIMAQYDHERLIVYQSYRPAIGHFAATHQRFGEAFSLNRMTWIKPNFLWMMFRNGWGQKEGQTVVLAIHLKRIAFEEYLAQAVASSFDKRQHASREAWQTAVKQSDVRLQWDPDHDPFGNKLSRRAIQIGLRNAAIKRYATQDIIEIEDISAFVRQQHKHVLSNNLQLLQIPAEKPYKPTNQALFDRLNISKNE